MGVMKLVLELGMVIVVFDISLWGDNIFDDDNGVYDFGFGVGFYVDVI